MRATIRLCLVGLLLAAALPAALAQTGIPWLYSIYEAQQVARQQRRLLLIHFYSDSCGPCRLVEQNVFPNPEVYRAMSMNYVPVKINAERAREIVAQYQVDRWPTDVIADSEGRILYKTVSPQDPARYVQLLNAVSADFRSGNPPVPVAAQPPAQSDPSYGNPYAAYNNQADPRSQFAGYTPAMAGGAPGTSTPMGPSGTPTAGWQDFGGAAPYEATPAPGTPPPAGQYDPRSAWSPSAGSFGQSAAPPAAPPRPQTPVDYSANPSAWQENRFLADGSATESPRVAAAPQAPAPSDTAGTPLTMDGYCPVTLAEQERWVKGDPRWGAVHRGRTYLFLSQQHQQRFLADPDRYSPVLSGYDPTRYIDRGELVSGQRRHGMWFRGKIYLFADEGALERFSSAPELYAQRAHEMMMSAGR